MPSDPGQDNPQQRAEQAFRACVAALVPGQLAIDCGANVGLFTIPMARQGARVMAFEPNPVAYQALLKAVEGMENVTALNMAVAADDRERRLFHHVNADSDPLLWSTGSSLLEFKGNVDPARYTAVRCFNIVDYICANGPVALLKIDIEGFEFEVLEALIDREGHRQVGQIFVELHDRKIEKLRPAAAKLRARIAEQRIDNINLDWV
jgi:FkbM family methyltransferase